MVDFNQERLSKAKRLGHWGFLFAAFGLLGGCATTLSEKGSVNVPVENRVIKQQTVVDGNVLPLPEQAKIQIEQMPEQQRSSVVVQRLLTSAKEQRRAGNADSAANFLERALRIEPKNAMLWGQLADIRYEQGNYQQAIQLAAKSNTWAGESDQLRRQNWYLMSNAYAALGNTAAEQKYREKLSQ